MFFSISIPIYNAEKYLDSCIESVMCQTEQDFELILVDDGSKDNSVAVCKKWAERFPERIRVIEKENTGSLFTRRVCLEASKGDYIYIMDADDSLVDKNMLKKVKDTLQNSNCDMVFFNCTTDMETKSSHYKYPFSDGEMFEGESLKKIYDLVLEGSTFNILWNKVFKRTLVDWNEDYSEYRHVTNGTDAFQMIPILSNAKSIVYMSDVFYFYRTQNNEGSIVHKFIPTIYRSGRENFLRISEFLKTCGYETDFLDSKLKTRYMRMAINSANRIKAIKKDSTVDVKEYLNSIVDDTLFKENYTLEGLNIKQRLLAVLLRVRCYYLVCKLVGCKKNI